MPKPTLKIAGLYKNLAVISEFMTVWAAACGLNEREVYAVCMAVDEACSNIIEHAYGGEGRGDIDLRCQKLPGGLKVTIKDRGEPFDPALVAQPDIQAPLEERDSGGLGLFLMRQLMDEVTFDFSPRGNTLVMVKVQEVSP